MASRYPESLLDINISRRDIIRAFGKAAFSAVAYSILSSGIARAQDATRETTLAVRSKLSRRTPVDAASFFGPDIESELVVRMAEVDVSTDEQINSLGYYSKKEDLSDGILRYTYPSRVAARPNIIITEKGGGVLFKRRLVTGLNDFSSRQNFSLNNINANYNPPNGYYIPPDFFVDPNQPRLWSTEIHSQFGVAVVLNQNTKEIGEVHLFKSTTIYDYIEKWSTGDYKKSAPPVPSSPPVTTAPESPPPAPAPVSGGSLLITVDGLGSSSDDSSFRIFHGGLPHDQIIPFSYSGNETYQPEDTFQDIFKSVDKLAELIDRHRPNFDFIDLMGYSLGGVVAWEYLRNHSRDTGIRAYALLDAPINGVPGADLSYFLSYMFRDRTLLGNEATNHLAALADTPEIQNRTIGQNRELARKLRDEAKIRGMHITNRDDCFTDTRSTTLGLSEFDVALPLGRLGIPNCSSTMLAPLVPGRDASNIGHTQILVDARAISEVIAFFRDFS